MKVRNLRELNLIIHNESFAKNIINKDVIPVIKLLNL